MLQKLLVYLCAVRSLPLSFYPPIIESNAALSKAKAKAKRQILAQLFIRA